MGITFPLIKGELAVGLRSFPVILFSLISISLFPIQALAGIRDVNPNNLPGSVDISSLLEGLRLHEPMLINWTPDWEYPIPKEDVVQYIRRAYEILDALSQSYPDNIEILLLKGLTAHYAYQLDIKEFWELAKNACEKAASLDPSDIGPSWFLAVHLTKSGRLKEGMERMLEISKTRRYGELPASFWEDYAYCSYISFMPSNAIMGLDHANEILGETSFMEKLMGKFARESLIVHPVEKPLKWKEIWAGHKIDDSVRVINRMFGFHLDIPSGWEIILGDYKEKNTFILLHPPAKPGLRGKVTPSILILAHLPEEGETTESLMRPFLDAWKNYLSSCSNW